MHAALRHPARLSAALVTTVLLALAVVLVAIPCVQSRSSVLAQLQRPALPVGATVGPGPAKATLHAGGYTIGLALNPNRTSVRDELAITLARGGRPVAGARVTIGFSMPAMNMWNGLTSSARGSGDGLYLAGEPLLGMPGVWQLKLRIASGASAPVMVTVDDQMGR
jgi:hypothetical protein